MSYAFWNTFVDKWENTAEAGFPVIPPTPIPTIHTWSNPNLIPLYNSGASGIPSLYYIPEPWWGNYGSSPLHCVFLNHNPGSGGLHQEHQIVLPRFGPGLPLATYQDLVTFEVTHYPSRPRTVFHKTCDWHKNSRSNKIINAISGIIGGTPIPLHDISMLLSIELIPWHTQGFRASELSYLLTNHAGFANNVLLFAANESRRIGNSVLQNKPLIRTTRGRILQILTHLKINGDISDYCISKQHDVPAYGYNWDCFTIKQKGFEEIIFFRIQHIGNDLPGYNGTEDFIRRVYLTSCCGNSTGGDQQ